MTEAVYGRYAIEYLEKGYNPLPLPPRQKVAPPDGYTGKVSKEQIGADVYQWVELRPNANIALRLPRGLVGIDVDNYGGKQGYQTMATACQQWGNLPVVGRLTSR